MSFFGRPKSPTRKIARLRPEDLGRVTFHPHSMYRVEQFSGEKAVVDLDYFPKGGLDHRSRIVFSQRALRNESVLIGDPFETMKLKPEPSYRNFRSPVFSNEENEGAVFAKSNATAVNDAGWRYQQSPDLYATDCSRYARRGEDRECLGKEHLPARVTLLSTDKGMRRVSYRSNTVLPEASGHIPTRVGVTNSPLEKFIYFDDEPWLQHRENGVSSYSQSTSSRPTTSGAGRTGPDNGNLNRYEGHHWMTADSGSNMRRSGESSTRHVSIVEHYPTEKGIQRIPRSRNHDETVGGTCGHRERKRRYSVNRGNQPQHWVGRVHGHSKSQRYGKSRYGLGYVPRALK